VKKHNSEDDEESSNYIDNRSVEKELSTLEICYLVLRIIMTIATKIRQMPPKIIER
jgi:hypothetical protein